MKETHENNKQYLTEYLEAIKYANIVLRGGLNAKNEKICSKNKI